MRAIDEENVNGVFWRDVDFPAMDVCDCCGITGADYMMAGHQNACRYLYKNQESPAGRAWLRAKIQQGIDNGWVKTSGVGDG